MFTKKSFILCAVFVTILCLSFLPNYSARAAPIDRFPLTVTQPDGTKLHLFASGDEFYNWLEDAQGYTVIRNPNTGYYVYANLVNGELVATNFVADKTDPAAVGLRPYLNISPKQKTKIRQTFLDQAKQGGSGGGGVQTTGTINNLVIFIRFSDEAEFTTPLSEYAGMLNDATAGANSLRNYYQEVSYNTLTIDSTFYPTPGATIVSYQDSHARAYYQPYDATYNPIGYQGGDNGMERNDREDSLLAAAVNYVNGLGQFPDAATIDGNGDGNVDSLTFVISGDPTGWSSLLWPHMSGGGVSATIDGKNITRYSFQLDAMLAYRGTGVLAHEMFHVLGAPDLYNYNSSGVPAGSWDLMDTDSNPPEHMGCYMKYEYGKWISNIPELSAPGTYSVNPLTSSTDNCYKIASPNSTTEFFVVEYRQKTGTFESSLPGSGLLVYRINTLTTGNAYGPPDEIYIYRPDGTPSQIGNVYMANFSSDEGRTAINDGTDPYSFLSDGSFGGLDLCNIGAPSTTIAFDICVGSVRYISGNAGVGGATLTYTDGVTPRTATANSTGEYAFAIPPGWTGTVTPSRVGYTFSPANIPYTNVKGDQTAQDYTVASSINLLQDPSFEAYNPATKNNPYWSAKSTNFGTPLCTIAFCGDSGGVAGPHIGSTWGWFGGTTRAETATLSQTVTIPSGLANLEFYLWMSYGNSGGAGAKAGSTVKGGGGGSYVGSFTAQIDDIIIFAADSSQLNAYTPYILATVDVSPWADGGAHKITFSATTNGQILNYRPSEKDFGNWFAAGQNGRNVTS